MSGDVSSEFDTLSQAMRELATAGQLMVAAAAERLGFTVSELGLMSLLRAGSLSAGQLADGLQLTTGAVTRILDGLQRRGFVVRAPDPADRRRVLVSLAGDGLGPIDEVFRPLLAGARHLRESYSEVELAAVERYVRESVRLVRTQAATLRGQAVPRDGFAVPRGAWTAGVLLARGGFPMLTVRSLPADDDALARLDGAGLPATMAVEPDPAEPSRARLAVRHDHRRVPHGPVHGHGGGDGDVAVGLATGLPWRIDLRAGARHVHLDLRGLVTGVVTGVVTITGGIQTLHLTRDAGRPVQLRVRGGCGGATLDGATSPGTMLATLRTPGWHPGPAGLDVTLTGGVGGIVVDVDGG